MKKNITITILAISAVVMIYLLLSDSCSKVPPDRSVEKEAIDRGDRELRDSIKLYERVVQIYVEEIGLKDSIIRQLKSNEKVLRKDSDKSKTTALQLREELRNYRDMDTADSYRKIDSLLVEVESLTYLLDQYMTAYDALSDAVEKRDSVKDDMSSKRAVLIAQMTKQYDVVFTEYNKVFSDNQSLQKSLKREKLKTKIAAIIALAGGILAAIK
jgi:hypothetical protein